MNIPPEGFLQLGFSFPDPPRLITNEAEHKYDIRELKFPDLRARYPLLAAALNKPISQFMVEFLNISSRRPRVAFRFVFGFPPLFAEFGELIVSCQLSVELTNNDRNQPGPGASQIQLQHNRIRPNGVATAGFSFPFRAGLTLGEIADVIFQTDPQGCLSHSMTSVGLARFHFHFLASDDGVIAAGCRDWM